MLKKLQVALLAATMVTAPALIAGVMYSSPAQAQSDKAQSKTGTGNKSGGQSAAKSSDQNGQKSAGSSSGSQSKSSSRESASGSSSRGGSKSKVSVNARGGSKSRTDVNIRTRERHARSGGGDSYSTEIRHSGSVCYKMVRRHGHMTKV